MKIDSEASGMQQVKSIEKYRWVVLTIRVTIIVSDRISQKERRRYRDTDGTDDSCQHASRLEGNKKDFVVTTSLHRAKARGGIKTSLGRI